MTRLLSLIITALMLTFYSQAQVVSMSLKEAQDYAVKNAYASKSASYDVDVAALQTEELIGIGLPQINGSVQYQNYLNLPTQLGTCRIFWRSTGRIC
jgi:hypothetical protein